MLILLFVNVGNSETDARDSIVVLTHIAWATIVTSASRVSYDLQTKTWRCSPRFCIHNHALSDWGAKVENEYDSD